MADDPALWAALQDVVARADPVPAHVVAAARDSLAWRDPDAALAALVADSASAVPAVRGNTPPRLLTFAVGDVILELEADYTASGIHLVGQLLPPQPARLRVDQPGGRSAIDADELGRFVVDIPAGPTRLHCTPLAAEGYSSVQTEWVRL
jgi:hypothetical protein